MKGFKKVDLRLPRDLLADLRWRCAGTKITLEQYINALLMVQVVGMIHAGKEEERRWHAHQRQREAQQRPPYCFAGVPPDPTTESHG